MPKQVVLIMVDTQSKWMLDAYDANRGFPLKNLRRLADGAAVFHNGYCATPTCGPSRSAIFTGQYPSTNEMIANAAQLGKDIKNAGERISSQGIQCGYIGKWHLDGGDYFGKGCAAEGFDTEYWYDMRNYMNELGDAKVRKQSRKNMGQIIFGDVQEEDTYAYRVTERALKYIDAKQEEDFFLTISYDEPHDPSQCPKEYCKMLKNSGYKLKDQPNTNASHEGKPDTQQLWDEAFKIPWTFLKKGFQNGFIPCNLFVDHCIGRVLDAIDEKLDNPLIIYTADHGDMMNAHGLMAKGPCMYQEIVNVPYIIKGGPFVNRTVDIPVSHVDLLPTIMEFLGLKIPRMLEGESLYKLKGDHGPRDVFMQFHRFENAVDGYLGLQLIRSIFDGRYKLNINLFSIDELYDLQEDPYEMKNLINDESHAAIRDNLHDRILKQQGDIVDPYRGYVWEVRPFRKDKKKRFECEGMTRERWEEDEIKLDYATGNPVESAVRVKGIK